MKILHIVWMLRFGGIETMLMNIANEQVIQGHKVGILLIDKDAADYDLVKRLDNKVRILYANRKYGFWDIPAYWRMNRIISKYDPDCIHLHSAAIFKYIWPNKRKICNVTLHDLCNKPNTDHIKKIPRVFAISQSVANDLKNKKGANSIVNPNGIRPELFSTSKKEEKNETFKIVQVSRLEHQKKGQHILVLAGKQLKEEGFTNFSITFIGNGSSREYLEQLVKNNNLQQEIMFLGMKDQQYINDHLCEYDLFVQPSIYEGFGLTVAEAMAAKVPTLVSSGQGPEEVINNGQCGYIFKNGDIKDCADKIKLFLCDKNNKDFTERAFERVWNLYNVRTTVQTYLNNYATKGN